MNNLWMMLRTHRYELLIILLSLVVTREWLLPGLPQTHDAEVHISRAAAFSRSILEGNVLPRWGGYFNWGYGTPSIMFLYPGIPYVAALVHLVTGLRFIEIYKLLIILSYVGSGIFWYLWQRSLGFHQRSAFVSALFFLLIPYRLLNIFVRGALAEHIGFFFFPLTFLCVTKYIHQPSSKWWGLSVLSSVGTILTHNLSALLYTPLYIVLPFLFLTFQKAKEQRRRWLIAGRAIIFGFFLTAFFWLPALFESRYTLASWLFTYQEDYQNHFLFPDQLLIPSWGYGWSLPGEDDDGMSFQIGIAPLVVLIVGFIVCWRVRYFWIGFGVVFIGVIMTLPISGPLWSLFPILQKFQFPWRFLSYVVIGMSIIVSVVAERMRKKILWICAMAIFSIVSSLPYWKIAGPSTLTEQFLTVDYVGTSDTGETTPIWAVRFQEHPAKAPVEIVSSDGTVEIDRIEKRMQEHTFRVRATAQSQIVDNTLYFPGWKVFVDDQETPVVYEDQNWRGLMTFPVTQGEHRVSVVFEETTLRKFADAISIIAAGILIVLLKLKVGGDKATASTS